MPRPSNVTDEDLARWGAAQQDYEQEHGPPPISVLAKIVPGFSPPSPKEVWCAGCWLARELEELGATEQEVEEVGFANGQHLLFAIDVWETSLQSLDGFKCGKWDKPGLKLAERLCRENLPHVIENSRRRN